MLKVTFTAEDKFATLLGGQGNDVMLPRLLTSRADFTDCPLANVNKAVLVPYGDLSSLSSASSPPTLTGTLSLGGLLGLDGIWLCGFGSLPCLCTPPTSVSAAAQSGGTLSADQWNSEYGVMITAVDANGRESDAYPYHTNYNDGGRGSFGGAVAAGIPIAYDDVNGSQKLHVSWSGATGPVAKYRVYLGVWYYGFRPIQYIETTATSCDFTASPARGIAVTDANITPSAHVASYVQFWWYAVSAIMPDGETGLSAEAFGITRGYRRPLRIEWLSVAGATGYRIYKRGPGAAGTGYIYRFEVGVQTYFDDDLTNVGATAIDGSPQASGLVPCLHVGTRADNSGFIWQAFLVAGCAIKSIEAVFFKGVRLPEDYFGVTWAVPTKPGYSTYFGSTSYVDINGNRYTLLFVRGPDGEEAANGAVISVTLKGVETSGNGTGSLITDLADQYEHWLRNFALRNRTTVAPWDFDGPTWNDSPNDVDLVDAASFAAVKAVWATRDPGSCPGAWVMGLSDTGAHEQVTARTIVARLNQSLDVFSGFTRKSQYAVKIINEKADLTLAPRYTATLGINAGSFKIEDHPEAIENRITAYHSLNAPKSEWSTMVVEDADSQAVLGETKPYELQLWCVRRSDVASEIARRRLARRKFPYRIVRWESDMGALTIDLGDIVRISHPDGAGSSGWTDRAAFVLRHEFDPQRFAITLEALDLDAVIAQLAAHVTVTSSGYVAVTGVAPELRDTILTAPGVGSVTNNSDAPTVVVA